MSFNRDSNLSARSNDSIEFAEIVATKQNKIESLAQLQELAKIKTDFPIQKKTKNKKQ